MPTSCWSDGSPPPREKAQRFRVDSSCCVLLKQDKLLDMGLLADFLLFHLNRQGAECQEAYCGRYAIREPIDDIMTVLVNRTVPAAALLLARLVIWIDDICRVGASPLQGLSKPGLILACCCAGCRGGESRDWSSRQQRQRSTPWEKCRGQGDIGGTSPTCCCDHGEGFSEGAPWQAHF